MKKKLTKKEKLNEELLKWYGITIEEEEDLLKYPVQSRHVLCAMLSFFDENKYDWATHTLVCPELGLQAKYPETGYPLVVGHIPRQRKLLRKEFCLLVAKDSMSSVIGF